MKWLRMAGTVLLAIGLMLPLTPSAQAATKVTCTAATALGNRPTVKAGDQGDCVRTLKNLLLTKGYSLGRMWPSATFDSATTTMLAAWQKDRGLPQLAVVDTATWKAIAATPAKKGYTVGRGPNTTGKVVLSFDDCPRSLTSFKKTVQAAEKLGIALVLFVTGDCVKAGRFSASYARKHGHYVFNHSVSHPNLAKLSKAKTKAQLKKPGVVTSYGRPPYGSFNATTEQAYRAVKMKIWTWTYDTDDWRGWSQATIVSRVVENATADSTILMHMQHNAFNPDALAKMVKGLAGRGLEVCANHPGTTPKAPAALRC